MRGGRRAAIVTGGGTGTGAATALMLADRGYDVLVNYSRSADEADATAGQCRQRKVDAFALQGDVGEDADCRRLVEAAVERWGRLDALVNSAGTTQIVPAAEWDRQSADDFRAIYGVNLIGAYQMTRAAAPHLKASGMGAVVNVSSISALNGSGSSFAYAASKGALNTLTLALARALAPEVRVNAVLPGLIESRWFPDRLGEEGYRRVRESWNAATPLGKPCSPEDVADTIAWLVDDAALLTGQLITIDGGFLLGGGARVSR